MKQILMISAACLAFTPWQPVLAGKAAAAKSVATAVKGSGSTVKAAGGGSIRTSGRYSSGATRTSGSFSSPSQSAGGGSFATSGARAGGSSYSVGAGGGSFATVGSGASSSAGSARATLTTNTRMNTIGGKSGGATITNSKKGSIVTRPSSWDHRVNDWRRVEYSDPVRYGQLPRQGTKWVSPHVSTAKKSQRNMDQMSKVERANAARIKRTPPKRGRDLDLGDDPRFPRAHGWRKTEHIAKTRDSRHINYHYQQNKLTGEVVDVKVKNVTFRKRGKK